MARLSILLFQTLLTGIKMDKFEFQTGMMIVKSFGFGDIALFV